MSNAFKSNILNTVAQPSGWGGGGGSGVGCGLAWAYGQGTFEFAQVTTEYILNQ